jgi:hypothetical protein
MNVVSRAALESYLVFHYIFIEAPTEEERRFRYSCWVLSDLMEKQKYPVKSPQGKKILEEDKAAISSLKSRLAGSPAFAHLSDKQKKGLLERGVWRFKGWTDIGISAGLSEVHEIITPLFLCHAGNLSVLQLRQADTDIQQKSLSAATMTLIMITMAYFIRDYGAIFSNCLKFVSDHEDVIKMWLDIGGSNLSEIEVDWSSLDV